MSLNIPKPKIDGSKTLNHCLQIVYLMKVLNIAFLQLLADTNGDVGKSDFIAYVKGSKLFKNFESVDPESDFHWNKKVRYGHLEDECKTYLLYNVIKYTFL